MSDEKKDPASPPADDAPQIHVGTLVRRVHPPLHLGMQPHQGRVTEIRRHLMANPSLDIVCFVDVHGAYREAQRSDLKVIHEERQASPPADDAPQIPDAYAYKVGDVVCEVVHEGTIPQIGVVLSISRPTGTRDPLKDFVRVRVSEKSVADSQRAKFRRIDSVMPTNLAAAVSFICESFDQMIKEQASQPAAHDTFIPDSPDATPARGDDGAPIPQGDPIPAPSVTIDAMEVSMIRDAQRRLEVSQAREKEALETIRRLRKELEEHQNMLANTKRLNSDALDALNRERNVSREALESAEAQAKRGDLWQDAAHDALEQAKLWRERAEEERAACARIMDERLTWQQRAEELRKAQELRETIERGTPVYNVVNVQMPPVNNEPDTRHESDDY